ncbi:MAG: hypothetical protein ACM3JQ_05630, partial [Candidatus Eiseniibacteriota bacterium]
IVGKLKGPFIIVLLVTMSCRWAHEFPRGQATKIADISIPTPNTAGIRIFLLTNFVDFVIMRIKTTNILILIYL